MTVALSRRRALAPPWRGGGCHVGHKYASGVPVLEGVRGAAKVGVVSLRRSPTHRCLNHLCV